MRTHGQQGGSVLVDLLAIAELVDGRNLRGLVHRRLVLHAHRGLEVVFQGKVEIANLVVDSQHGREAYARLVAQQVHALVVFLQRVQALQRALQLLLLCHQIGRGGCSGSLVLGYAGIHLGQTAINGGRGLLHEAAEVNISPSGVHHDVANLGLVGGIAIEDAHAAIERQVGIHLVGGTQLKSEVVLAALHVAIHVVALCT